jgi:hypothetical protein
LSGTRWGRAVALTVEGVILSYLVLKNTNKNIKIDFK